MAIRLHAVARASGRTALGHGHGHRSAPYERRVGRWPCASDRTCGRRGHNGTMASSILRLGLIVALLTTASCRSRDVPALPALPANQLHAVADFAVIADRGDRSRALFLEASRVFLHPRCANCHPNGDVPAQGMQMTPHQPPVTRGPDNHGVVGMECTSCHQDRNLVQARVPGAPDWHLAPREMAWIGKSPRQICEQIKDPKRNGGKSLAADRRAQRARQGARRVGLVSRE